MLSPKLSVEQLIDIFEATREVVETELAVVESNKDNYAPIVYVEKSSFHKGKLYTINAVLNTLKNTSY